MTSTDNLPRIDDELTVRSMVQMGRYRLGRPRLGARAVLEAEAGAFDRWSLRVGDRLEVG